MTDILVDASGAAKWFFPEEHPRQSLGLLSARSTPVAPDLIVADLSSSD